jgi:aryl-alcohol dehydrogenase-like predicted oxidoreductase
MRGRFPEWYVRENVEKSLKRLGVERIDLYQMHTFMSSAMIELDWLETLHKLRREGKVDRIGVSLRDNEPDEGFDAAQFGIVDSFQVIFNMFEQRPAQSLFPAGEKSNVAFIARVPLDSGALVGNWTSQSYAQFEPGSQPHNMFRGERFGETLKRVQALKDICTPHYSSLAEAAMRYVLSEPQISTLIPGMKNRKEVDMNIAYCDGKSFPAELKAQLQAHLWVRNYYH